MWTQRVLIVSTVRELVLTPPCREEVKNRCFSTHLFGGQKNANQRKKKGAKTSPLETIENPEMTWASSRKNWFDPANKKNRER